MKEKIILLICAVLLLASCGVSRKAERQQETEVQQETTVQKDTLPPTHPPVVVPHRWNEGRE